jgi:hypothetical protein
MVAVLSAQCASVLIDNETYVQPASFSMTFVNVETPPEFRHEGGYDNYVLQFVSSDSRVVSESQSLGLNALNGTTAVASVATGTQVGIKTEKGDNMIMTSSPQNQVQNTTEVMYLHWVVNGAHHGRLVNAHYLLGDQLPASSDATMGGPLMATAAGLAQPENGTWGFAEAIYQA